MKNHSLDSKRNLFRIPIFLFSFLRCKPTLILKLVSALKRKLRKGVLSASMLRRSFFVDGLLGKLFQGGANDDPQSACKQSTR